MPQLVITGCHRSSTSLLASQLQQAGLFIGDNLLGANSSNAKGHFEDESVLALNEKILKANGQDWSLTQSFDFQLSAASKRKMKAFIQKRDQQHLLWGFKEPRTTVLLEHWWRHLKDPYGVFVYRSFTGVYFSLFRRHARQLIQEGGRSKTRKQDIKMFSAPDVALRVWLTYNKALLKHFNEYANRCVMISFDRVMEGFPVAAMLEKRWRLGLDVKSDPTDLVDPLLSRKKTSKIYTKDASLKKALIDMQNSLVEAERKSLSA